MSQRASTRTTPTPAPHWYELDALRFVAALAVLAFHYTVYPWNGDASPPAHLDALSRLTRYTYLSIHAFFLVSGFAIAATVKGRSAAQFALARARRLYPTFWIACTVTAIAGMLGHGDPVGFRQWLVNLTMLESFAHVAPADGVYWTLDIEIRFYVLVALVLLAGGRRWLVPLSRVWLAAAVLAMYVPLPHQQLFCYAYAPLLVAGITYHDMLERRTRAHWLTLAVAITASVMLALREIPDIAAYYGLAFSPAVVTAGLLALHALFLALVTGVVRLHPRPWLVALGTLTYPLYLVHENVGFIGLRVLVPRIGIYPALLVVTATVLAFAWLINELASQLVTPAWDAALAAARRGARRAFAAALPSTVARAGD